MKSAREFELEQLLFTAVRYIKLLIELNTYGEMIIPELQVEIDRDLEDVKQCLMSQ